MPFIFTKFINPQPNQTQDINPITPVQNDLVNSEKSENTTGNTEPNDSNKTPIISLESNNGYEEYDTNKTTDLLNELYSAYEYKDYDGIIEKINDLIHKYDFTEDINREVIGIYDDAQYAKMLENASIEEMTNIIAMSVTPKAMFYNIIYSMPNVTTDLIADKNSHLLWIDDGTIHLKDSAVLDSESSNTYIQSYIEKIGKEYSAIYEYVFTFNNNKEAISYVAQDKSGKCIFIGTYGADVEDYMTVYEWS